MRAGRHFLAIRIAYLAIHRTHDAAGRTEDSVTLRVGADDRRSLTQTVTLEHGNTDSVVITLQLDVEQRATAHEEQHTATQTLTHCLENQFVEQSHQRTFPQLTQTALVPVFLVVLDVQLQRVVVQRLHFRAFLLDARLDILLEITRQRGHTQHHVRTRFLNRHRDVLQRSQSGLAYRNGSDTATRRHHEIETRHVRKTVVHRQDDQHHAVHGYIYHRVRLLHVRRIVAVSQQDTLRVGRSARSVRDVRVVVRTNTLVARLELRLMLFQELITHFLNLGDVHLVLHKFHALVEDNHFLHQRTLAQDLANLR